MTNYYSIVPPSGEFGPNWPNWFNLPQGGQGQISSAGWTSDDREFASFNNEGFVQQTFLGASIQRFDLNAGFGDTASTMSITVVNDEYNISDGNGYGKGDDPYHNGQFDVFAPPPVGTPVYFKFGKNPADTEQAWRQTWDDLYDIKTLPKRDEENNPWGIKFPTSTVAKESFLQLEPYHYVNLAKSNADRSNNVYYIEDRSKLWDEDEVARGRCHFVFGGVLQSYTQNVGTGGAPVYSVQLTDPREILSNVQLILNEYQGSVFSYKNMINIYGFLEYDPSAELIQALNTPVWEGKLPKPGVSVLRSKPPFITEFTPAPEGNPVGTVSKYYTLRQTEFNDGSDRVSKSKIQYQGLKSFYDATCGRWVVVSKRETTEDDSLADVLLPSGTVSGVNGQYSYEKGEKKYNLKDEYFIEDRSLGNTSYSEDVNKKIPQLFPITGQGMSRRSDKGIPFYRVKQALRAMLQMDGELPQEYIEAGFTGTINFRGFNYVVDLDGLDLDKIPLMYNMDFGKLDLLSFAQEICDITSSELFVQLLPIIDHPACKDIYDYNTKQILDLNKPENIIAGVIHLSAIDKSQQPKYGAIKTYIDLLKFRGIPVEQQDVGFELSNVVTDKFVVGGQKVDMHYFHTERDRDNLWQEQLEGSKLNQDLFGEKQWELEYQLQQQVLPYYGLLGENAVTIPRGNGPFTQILLDSRNLNAFGVGDYYVATELEMRAAMVSFDAWKNMLLSYNDAYIEDVADRRVTLSALGGQNSSIQKPNEAITRYAQEIDIGGLNSGDDESKAKIQELIDELGNREYAVSVPRCVWHSDKPYIKKLVKRFSGKIEEETTEEEDPGLGGGPPGGPAQVGIAGDVIDSYPASPCSPPLGYPLYYKRAQNIGIIEAGVAKLMDKRTRLVKNHNVINQEYENKNSPLLRVSKRGLADRIGKLREEINEFAKANKSNPEFRTDPRYVALLNTLEEVTNVYQNYEEMQQNLKELKGQVDEINAIFEDKNDPLHRFMLLIEKTAKRHNDNAKKVHQFVKKIADECLGRKFMVRIPRTVNWAWNKDITGYDPRKNYNIKGGPWGFKPRTINKDPNVSKNLPATTFSKSAQYFNVPDNLFQPFLQDYQDLVWTKPILHGLEENEGALKGNWNPLVENWEFNYKPEPKGGYHPFEIFRKHLNILDYRTYYSDANDSAIFNNGIFEWPEVVRNGLAPVDMNNLMAENQRVQCYVKYNNSDTLDFTSVDPSDMTQQQLKKGVGPSEFGFSWVPDLIEQLPNNNIDTKFSFDHKGELLEQQADGESKPKQVAFVKCELDEKFYMPPQKQKLGHWVYGNDVDFKFHLPEPEIDVITEGCETVTAVNYPYLSPVFSIPDDGGKSEEQSQWTDFKRYRKYDPSAANIGAINEDGTEGEFRSSIITNCEQSNNIVTDLESLDDCHVYAVVTVPGKVTSTFDSRWRDGPLQNINTVEFAHLMTQDVINHPIFSSPASFVGKEKSFPCVSEIPKFATKAEAIEKCKELGFAPTASYIPTKPNLYVDEYGVGPKGHWLPGQRKDWYTFNLGEITTARDLAKKTLKGLVNDDPATHHYYTMPGPIIPDIFAIPLMSMEMCYGPWLSSFSTAETGPDIAYSDIGGQVEFVKDESLSPWEYAGYQLMNEAGQLQAQFSNSLLLFSERGGFVVPDAPTGIALSKALLAG